MDTHQDMDPLATFQHQHGEVSEWLALIAALPDPAGSVSFAAIEDELIVPLLERHGAALGQRIGGGGVAGRREGG